MKKSRRLGMATAALFSFCSISVSAAISQFTGSLYMLDPSGNPAFVNTQCPGCNASIGEIDLNLTTLLDLSTGTAGDISGNHPLLDTGLDWSMTNLSFVINPDSTISASGNFLWTNYSGLTTSTYSQLSQPLGAYGELIALDGDMDGIKGQVLFDGPFAGNTIYLEGTISTIPLPAAFWLFGSGLLGLIGISRHKIYT